MQSGSSSSRLSSDADMGLDKSTYFPHSVEWEMTDVMKCEVWFHICAITIIIISILPVIITTKLSPRCPKDVFVLKE